MKISHLKISNFRGIKEIELSDLGTAVIIAGQNGSGKSCLFDGIRLLKSVYGGYQQNEWQQWMGEFQIQLTNRSEDFKSMFNNPTQELRISADFSLSEDERNYIARNANELVREVIWRGILPEAYEWGGYRMAMFAAQFRQREPEVKKRTDDVLPKLMQELNAEKIHGECFIPVGGTPRITNSNALSIVFSTFRPREIGVIDYHGAQRHYGRELVQGINLNLDANPQQRSQHTLYNSASKYANVKSEMAGSYVREILAEKAGVPQASQSTLTNTLKELFQTFFPEKEFLGPQPTKEGMLSFPVRTPSGNEHDLDELSAGEKEILYGYLRIRNSAPRHSIILMDEPELHLNPRLIRGLPQFYRKHLGEELGNQIWLVTHSDALLREVVGRETYDVYHMLPCDKVQSGESQLKRLEVFEDLELALIDLVGDLASYRPGSKVVIFEGGGDSDFDKKITASLFPELLEHANLISGTNKARVRALHEILDSAAKQGQLPFEFFSVTDRDAGDDKGYTGVNSFEWDVYHIENYFLEPKFIGEVLDALDVGNALSEEKIFDELRECARETLPSLVRQKILQYANKRVYSEIQLNTDPKRVSAASALFDKMRKTVCKLESLLEGDLAEERLAEFESDTQNTFETELAAGDWVTTFRGRDVLKRFAGKFAPSVSYDVFRNLIVSRMKDAQFQPPGMAAIVKKIMG